MSVAKSVTVFCDKTGCHNRFEGGTGETVRDVRRGAKSEGWKLGKKRDLCQACDKEIKEAVRVLLEAGSP